MQRSDAVEGPDGHRRSRRLEPPWYRPLGSVGRARALTDLILIRAAAKPVPAPAIDIDRGVVASADGRWSASLAPTAGLVANVPATEWPSVVDREIERWNEAATAAGLTGFGHDGEDPALPVIVRLTEPHRALGSAVRPAFGPLVWEAVNDLGAVGVASLPTGVARQFRNPDAPAWRRASVETVSGRRHLWSRLDAGGATGAVLSGPGISSLLFDPDQARREPVWPVRPGTGGPVLVTTFTNSLLLVVDERGADGLAGLVDSLYRFTEGRRPFGPVTIRLDDAAVNKRSGVRAKGYDVR